MKISKWALGALLLGAQAFAADSLTFGRVNNGVAEVQVYVDKDEGIPRCMNCVRFNVLVADRSGPVGTPFINRVLIKIKNTNPAVGEIFVNLPRVVTLEAFAALWRTPSSPAKSDQYAISLPGSVPVADLSFELLATRPLSLRDAAGSQEAYVAVEGTFSGQDLLALNAVGAREIARGDR